MRRTKAEWKKFDAISTHNAKNLLKDSHKYFSHIGQWLGKSFGIFMFESFYDVKSNNYRFMCKCVKCGKSSVRYAHAVRLCKAACRNCSSRKARNGFAETDKEKTLRYRDLDKNTTYYKKHVGQWLGIEFGRFKTLAFHDIYKTRTRFMCECLVCGTREVKNLSCVKNDSAACSKCQARKSRAKKLGNYRGLTMDKNEIKATIDRIYDENAQLTEKVLKLEKQLSEMSSQIDIKKAKSIFGDYAIFIEKLETLNDPLVLGVFKSSSVWYDEDGTLKFTFPARYSFFEDMLKNLHGQIYELLQESFTPDVAVKYIFEVKECQQKIQ